MSGALVLGLLWIAGVAAAPEPAVGDVAPVDAGWDRKVGGCEARYCYAVQFWVAQNNEGSAVASEPWLSDQWSRARHHFKGSGIGFIALPLKSLPATNAHVATRSDRDGLGRGRHRKGDIHVFVVSRLDNIDAPGEIRGVHWRQRTDRLRRWIILSTISKPDVLAHELGHLFGLPHSGDAASIMNKAKRAEPPVSERSFTRTERHRIERRRRELEGLELLRRR